MKIVHAADLHIDSRLKGLQEYDGAPTAEVRDATRRSFENIVQLCLDDKAEILLLAGDIFDSDWRDFSTGLFFEKQLARLSGCTRVFQIRGNHDSEHEITKRLPAQEHVTIFNAKKAHTIKLEEHKIALHGMSFPEREVSWNMVPDYPAPVVGYLNIGLLHTNATGSKAHDTYAPCTVPELVAKGYDYWALGHVHNREILHRDPYVVYPGNSQGRHIRETGAKGCMLIEVDGGVIRSVEFKPTDVLRWFAIEIAVGLDDAEGALRNRLKPEIDRIAREADGRTIAARVSFRGRTRHYAKFVSPEGREHLLNAVRMLASESPEPIWVEKVEGRFQPAQDPGELASSREFVGRLVSMMDEALADPHQLSALFAVTTPLREKLGAQVDEVKIDDPEKQKAWVEQARERLVAQLMGEGA